MFSATYKSLCTETLCHRFSTCLLSETYKSLFRQLFCFLIYTKRSGVTPSIFHWQPLAGRDPAFPFRHFSANYNLSLAVPKNATYNLSPRLRSQSMAVVKKSKSQKSAAKANKANGKPNGKPDPRSNSPQQESKARAAAAAAIAAPRENEAQIAVHWKEEECFYPSPKFIGQANLNDPAMVERFSEKNFPECFREYAELLHWDQYWHTTLDTSNPPFWKWFVGGKLNACYNCVDRHLAEHKNKAALIFVPEPEGEAATVITYQELYRRV